MSKKNQHEATENIYCINDDINTYFFMLNGFKEYKN